MNAPRAPLRVESLRIAGEKVASERSFEVHYPYTGEVIGSGDAEQAGRVMFDHVIESKERALATEVARRPIRAKLSRKGA